MSELPIEIKEAICKELGMLHWASFNKIKEDTIRPARKYAFYNPEPVNREGAVEFKYLAWPLWVICILFMGMTLRVMLYLEKYGLGALLLGVEVILLILLIKRTQGRKVRLDRQKISMPDADYYWTDFTGAYIVTWRKEKGSNYYLVLMRPNNTWVSLDMGGLNINRLGTAIRDMEPISWKE
ncbi:hypothetical protein CLV59_105312 [Chitinophaga dinghuensis]|uniref:Uncharacterized protein n=1 Tax=Chitinophaga dinghuensis TaxID=1539050 RepID=A0A327VZM2_9BACT|nr:hypothetical protein [Chitinophaga dinghuensis]RAJ80204.1 hypothetical protein CLV59_105312 [Chitinophaga dinghuensis]